MSENTMNINEEIPYEIDPEQDKPRTFTVPDGVYALTAWDVILKKSKNNDPLMNVTFGVNGTNGTKWLYHYITLLPKSSKGHGMAIHALKTLGFSMDKSSVNFRPSDIIGKVCRAKLVTEEFQSTNHSGDVITKSKNVIKEMLYPLPEDKPEMKPVPAEAKTEEPYIPAPF